MHEAIDSKRPAAANQAAWIDRYLPAGGEEASTGESTINLTMIRGILFRQRHILIGVVAVSLVAGLVLTLLTKPIYSASATVQLDTRRAQIIEGQGLDSDISPQEMGRYMNTQGVVIRSRKLAYRVVDSLKLDNNPKFLGEMATDPKPAGVSAQEWARARREAAASIAQGGVQVDVPYDSGILTISFQSEDPQIAKDVADAYADSYVLEDSRSKLEANTYAVSYLGKQIEEVRGKLQKAEFETNDYAKNNGIVGEAPQTGGASDEQAVVGPTITATNLFSVNSTYTQARAKRIAAEQRWRAISGVPASQLPEVQQNGSIQAMVIDRAKAATELAQLRQRYGDNFPRIVELKSQISSLDSQIARASADVKNSIRNDYEVALRQEQGLANEVNKASGETLTEQDRRVRYNLLNREAGALRTQLNTLLDRYNQLLSAADVKSSTTTKLDGAMLPGGPISPNLTKNLLVAAIAGFGIALGLALLREAFDDRLRSADDVERKLGYPLLGHTPMVADDELSEQFLDPFSPLMEAYSSVRTAVDFAYPGSNRVFLVTSSEPSEGKSLTAAILGRNYARLGRKTLLVESDLRKPSLSHLFADKRPEKGIVEVLLGDVDIQSVLLPSNTENLDILPVGKTPVNPVELLSSPVMADFIERIRKDYALVIFDTAPVMGLADAPLLSRLVDGTIFIVEANRAHYGQAKTALRRLRNASANVLGVVLTKYRAADAGQDYNYNYHYYTYGEGKGTGS